MTGACTIDSVDISTLGMFITKGGDNGFILFPEQKEPDSNDWPEEDGLEVDNDKPVFNARKFTVQYCCTGNETNLQHRINTFYQLHYQPGTREIYIREFGTTFQLRFVGISNYQQKHGYTVTGDNHAFIDVDYVMDDPVQIFSSSVIVPINPRPIATHVKINATDLAEFGVIVRDIYPTAMQRKLKAPLLISSKYTTGQVADVNSIPAKQQAEVTIKCTMTANNVMSFWVNYNALWANVSAGKVTLGLTALQHNYNCWYKKMGNFIKRRPFAQRVIVDFNLVLVAYGNYELKYLLATESGDYVTTEADEDCINMNLY